MNPLEVSVVFVGGLALAVVFYLLMSVQARQTRGILSALTPQGETDATKLNQPLSVRISQALPILDSLVVSSQREPMRKKLRRLGYAGSSSLRVFAGAKLGLGLVLGLLGVALGSSQPATAFLLGAAFLALGVYLPDLLVDRRIQAIEGQIQMSLPGVIDLLNICIRSGMNLEKAISRVTQEAAGPLAIDLQIIAERSSLGDSIEDAVKNLTAQQEISRATSSFLSTVSRATRLGVPLSNVIEQTADDMRKQQIDAVKTSAAKLPVKILLPLMLFLLPAVLLIVLGPAILSLIDGFAAL